MYFKYERIHPINTRLSKASCMSIFVFRVLVSAMLRSEYFNNFNKNARNRF